MARIETYDLDSVINDADKVIGSDGVAGPNYGVTKNYTVGELKDHISSGINPSSVFAGWARYDSTESFSTTPIDIADGSYGVPVMSLAANQLINPYSHANGKLFEFNSADVNSTYVITIVFKASAANANQTHVDVNFISGSTDYERLGKSIGFYKGNSVVQNFHEVFQLYVDADLVTYGLSPRFYADGGSIKLGDAIYFIQKTQTA